MATPTSLARLKSQLLTSGLQQKDNALYQIINSLIDGLISTGFTADEAAASSGGGGSSSAITALTGDVTATGPGSVPATIADDAVTDAKLRESAALSVIGRSANSTGNPADIAAANDGEVLRRSGATLGFGQVVAAGIASDAVITAKILDKNVTYAKIQDISATSRILGRKTAGSGVTEELTVSDVLDFLGGAAQGDIIYRGSSGWDNLAAGTAGQVLQSNGASANPSWVTPGAVPSNLGWFGSNSPFCFWSQASAASIGQFGVASINPGTVVGTNSLVVNSADGLYQQYVTGAIANQNAGWLASTTPWIDWSFPFDISFIFRTGSDITNARFWIVVAAGLPGSVDTATTRLLGFRYSTVAGDAGWIGVTNDGTNQSTTSSIASIAASTKYSLRVRSTGSTAFYSVNNGAESSLSATFPTGATRVGVGISVYTTTNSAKTIQIQRIIGNYGL